uniref:Uncharacterized protein n=1 Tax=Timema bartmani TaxID=61472 RepID=A0A7R9F3Y8_9NEOP|nr:unnamed protein product [Timema bartmani]
MSCDVCIAPETSCEVCIAPEMSCERRVVRFRTCGCVPSSPSQDSSEPVKLLSRAPRLTTRLGCTLKYYANVLGIGKVEFRGRKPAFAWRRMTYLTVREAVSSSAPAVVLDAMAIRSATCSAPDMSLRQTISHLQEPCSWRAMRAARPGWWGPGRSGRSKGCLAGGRGARTKWARGPPTSPIPTNPGGGSGLGCTAADIERSRPAVDNVVAAVGWARPSPKHGRRHWAGRVMAGGRRPWILIS